MFKYTIAVLWLFALVLNGCSSAVESSAGRKAVEQLLFDLKNEKYEALDSYYTPSSNVSEPLQAKVQKYIRLQETTGPIQSFEFVSENAEYDDVSGYEQLTLIYKVVCSRITLKETFVLVNEEGKSGIFFQNTENWPDDSSK